MESFNCDISQMRIRYYGPTHRGVHAATDIKMGSLVMELPQESLLTIKDALAQPLGQLMDEAGLFGDETLFFKSNNFMAAWFLEEIYKEREDPEYFTPL